MCTPGATPGTVQTMGISMGLDGAYRQTLSSQSCDLTAIEQQQSVRTIGGVEVTRAQRILTHITLTRTAGAGIYACCRHQQQAAINRLHPQRKDIADEVCRVHGTEKQWLAQVKALAGDPEAVIRLQSTNCYSARHVHMPLYIQRAEAIGTKYLVLWLLYHGITLSQFVHDEDSSIASGKLLRELSTWAVEILDLGHINKNFLKNFEKVCHVHLVCLR